MAAVEPAEVAVLPAARFWEMVTAHPWALLAVTRLVCRRYRHLLAWVEDASLKPLPARLASCLLAAAQAGGPPPHTVRLSQELLAAQLGVARQTVNRQLKAWEQAGWVRLQYGAVVLLAPAALRRLA